MVRSEADKKTGIFGGTFNPFHKGHLNAAEFVFESLGLNELIFIPVFIPPHKSGSELVSSHDRIKIIEISIENRPGFFVSDIEIKRKGLSYTIDTLEQIKKNELFFIMGSDSFLSFNKWHKYKDILRTANLAVASRPGFKPQINILGVDGYFPLNTNHYSHPYYKDVYIFNINEMDISSTYLRKMIKQKKNISDYVNEKAACYIEEKGLYKDEKSNS
jgi:nicotinate-nucleotide adenylyltransferase